MRMARTATKGTLMDEDDDAQPRRARDATFNVTIETDYDPTIGEVEIVPQEMGRVFLNIVDNGCQAASEKQHFQSGVWRGSSRGHSRWVDHDSLRSRRSEELPGLHDDFELFFDARKHVMHG